MRELGLSLACEWGRCCNLPFGQPMPVPKPKHAQSGRRINSKKPSRFVKHGFDLDMPTLTISGVVLFIAFFTLQVVFIAN